LKPETDERRDDDEAEIDLGHYLLVLSRRRWIVIAALVVCVLSAALYAFTAQPVFRAEALILIEKERRDPNYNEGMMVETSADDYYQTQYQLLKSKSCSRKSTIRSRWRRSRSSPGAWTL